MMNSRSGLAAWCVIFASCFSVLFLAGCGRGEPDTGTKIPSTEEGPSTVPSPSREPITEERTFYDFETDLDGWEVPIWAEGKNDYVAREVMISPDVASSGAHSMRTVVDFPGNMWSAGLVEIQQYLNLSSYRVISGDIYIPGDVPLGLKAKFILTVGNNWKWVEMSRSVPLIPGEWVTLTASIEPGSYDWKRVVPDEKFAEDVRKIALRIESNRKPRYSGPVYIDNIRVGK